MFNMRMVKNKYRSVAMYMEQCKRLLKVDLETLVAVKKIKRVQVTLYMIFQTGYFVVNAHRI